MPITPLHFGVLAPVNHWFPGKVSLPAFILINLWMDGLAILHFGFGLPQPEFHPPTSHSFLAALFMASAVTVFAGLFTFSSTTLKRWAAGAFYGGITHVLLDMLVHSEMQPLYPIHWNPFYVGFMQPISFLLLPLMIWFIVQIVSLCGGRVRNHRAEAPDASQPAEPGNPADGPGRPGS